MSGRLVTVVGSMGSGKTEKLINMFKDIENQGRDVVIYKPTKDTRTSSSIVKSRNGATAPATPVLEIDEIYECVAESKHIVLVDEVQFFNEEDAIDSLVSITLLGVDVYCFGLDLNAEGEVFGHVGRLLAHSDEVIKLEGVCAGCGGKARMTSYLGFDKGGEVKVGDLDEYEPLCRDCYYRTSEGEYDLDDLEVIGDAHDFDGDPVYFVTLGGKGYGFLVDLVVRQSSLDKAGYTLEEVKDIVTMEGVNNLLDDLGLTEREE